MRLNTAPRRAGFTLIELLVVMSIVAVLVGLGVGATMKFREASVSAAADNQLKMLQLALHGQYDKVVSDCNKSNAVPDAVLTYAGGDVDRARAIHTAAMLRTTFPETVDEAKLPFTVGTQTYNATPRAAFKKIAAATTLTADEAGAALLYAVLEDQAVGAGNSEISTMRKGEVKGFPVFQDPYGTPVRYYRWARSSELDASPYTPPSAASKDPLDPKNKVTATYTATLNASPYFLGFTGNNRAPSVVSFGKDKTNNNFAAGSDDRVGYRLDRQGNQGK